MFGARESWVFPSGPAGHQEIDSRMDLAAHQPAQSGFVQGVILAKRSDQRSPASCEHVEFPLCGVVPGRPSLDLGRQAPGLSQLAQDLAEFKKALLPDYPASRPQRPSREAFTAPRGVAQRDGVGRRIKPNLVRPRMRASTVRAYGNGTMIATLFYLLDQFEQRSRRSIFLGTVMNLPGPGPVLRFVGQQTRSLRDNPQENADANRVVGTPHEADAGFLHHRPHALQMIQPAGCAHHHVHAERSKTLDVPERRGGDGELNGRIDAAQVLARDALAAGVIV